MSWKVEEGFIVDFWEKIFEVLSKISLFYWIRKIIKNYTYSFVDAWVLGNLFFSIISTLLIYLLLWR